MLEHYLGSRKQFNKIGNDSQNAKNKRLQKFKSSMHQILLKYIMCTHTHTS